MTWLHLLNLPVTKGVTSRVGLLGTWQGLSNSSMTHRWLADRCHDPCVVYLGSVAEILFKLDLFEYTERPLKALTSKHSVVFTRACIHHGPRGLTHEPTSFKNPTSLEPWTRKNNMRTTLTSPKDIVSSFRYINVRSSVLTTLGNVTIWEPSTNMFLVSSSYSCVDTWGVVYFVFLCPSTSTNWILAMKIMLCLQKLDWKPNFSWFGNG